MELTHLGMRTGSNVVTCPYNKSHVMPSKTLMIHLTKCPDKGTKVNRNMSVCPFNSCHVVKSVDLSDHESQCPSRLGYDQMLYETSKNSNFKKPEINYTGCVSKEIINDQDKDWGPDCKPKQTIPDQSMVQTIKPCFLKPPAGLSKSERKKYRAQGHQAFSNVDASFNPSSNISDRLYPSTSIRNTNVNQQVKSNGLFFGKRPNT